MGGVDVSDQLVTAYIPNHKPMGFYWRRVFEQHFQLTLGNGWLVFLAWLTHMSKRVAEELKKMGSENSDPGARVREGPSAGLTRKNLEDIRAQLKTLARVERSRWLRSLSMNLRLRCRRGDADAGGSRLSVPRPSSGAEPREERATWEQPLASVRECNHPDCNAETKGACRCEVCTSYSGCGVVMCKSCFCNAERHRGAGEGRASTVERNGKKPRKKRDIFWPTPKKKQSAVCVPWTLE